MPGLVAMHHCSRMYIPDLVVHHMLKLIPDLVVAADEPQALGHSLDVVEDEGGPHQIAQPVPLAAVRAEDLHAKEPSESR